MIEDELRGFLEYNYDKYCRPEFIETDPIRIPHMFTRKEDIEISGFLAATIAWGQRVTILKNASRMMQLMGCSPYDYLMSASDEEFKQFASFVHRTFNGQDCIFFLRSLQHVYKSRGGLEQVFTEGYPLNNSMKEAIENARKIFFELPHEKRTEKHFAEPSKGATAKRLNMFLRWMVRTDTRGIDFGLWEDINPKDLQLPLDLHTGNVSRKLGLLQRKQNDWKAVEEVTTNLARLDPMDPVKYDFALFGLGIFEKF